MKLEDQVATLEQSKKLKELGVQQNGFASWVDCPSMTSDFLSQTPLFVCPTKYIGSTISTTNRKEQENIEENTYSAFTVAELGEMLPEISMSWHSTKFSNGWDCIYSDHVPSIELGSYPTEAEARAAMLIHLLENKLINP